MKSIIVWADYDPKAKRGNKWAFYTTKAEQRGNRPDLKPIKLSAKVLTHRKEILGKE